MGFGDLITFLVESLSLPWVHTRPRSRLERAQLAFGIAFWLVVLVAVLLGLMRYLGTGL